MTRFFAVFAVLAAVATSAAPAGAVHPSGLRVIPSVRQAPGLPCWEARASLYRIYRNPAFRSPLLMCWRPVSPGHRDVRDVYVGRRKYSTIKTRSGASFFTWATVHTVPR